MTPRSKITGYLEIGINPETFEIVINLDEDRNGIGHVTFSPDQARNLASILIRKADEADKDWQAAVASTNPAPEIPAPATARNETNSGSGPKITFNTITGSGKKRKPHK